MEKTILYLIITIDVILFIAIVAIYCLYTALLDAKKDFYNEQERNISATAKLRKRVEALEYDHRNLRKYVLPPEDELILHKVEPRKGRRF